MSKMGQLFLETLLEDPSFSYEDYYRHMNQGVPEEDIDCPECKGEYIDFDNICKNCGQNFNNEEPDNN